MNDSRIACVVCGQDYLSPYRNLLDGEQFLLCPECDSVWLEGDDLSEMPRHSLHELFADHEFKPGEVDWDVIDPVEP